MMPIKHIFTLLFLLFAIQATGKRDSMLWVNIKEMGQTYQKGLRDSALAKTKRLLLVAEEQDDDLAQAQLHSVIGLCYNDQGNRQAAIEELQKCITIGEANDFIGKAAQSSHNLYLTAMLPAYSMVAIYYKDQQQIKKAANYSKKGMEWIRFSHNIDTWASSISAFSEVLMAHKEYDVVYEPLKQGVQAALKQKQADFALMMISHLIYIEYKVMHRQPKDIPWIKAGELLLSDVRTETAKTTFLAVTKLTIPQSRSEEQQDHGKKILDSIRQTHSPVPTIAKTDSIPTRIEYIHLRNERIGIVGAFLILALFILAIYILWQRYQHKRTVRQTEHQMEERYIEGQEDERNRLAKELHDGISNQLLAVEMKLNEEGLTPQTMQLLSESREQVRRVSHELIPPEFEHATLSEVIRNYVDSVNGLNHCEVSYMQTPQNIDWSEIPPGIGLEIYRIIQEAVSNALKHANTTSVSIGLHMDTDNLRVLISNNGTRKDNNETSAGIGKHTISQRASSIKGKIDFIQHQYGSTVQLTVNRQELQNNV